MLAGSLRGANGHADPDRARRKGLALSALCVGAMVLARTIDDDPLADALCGATREVALDIAAA